MPTGILSRRCECGQIHFFVEDQKTAYWLDEQNRKILPGSNESSIKDSETGSNDIFVCGTDSRYCSSCGSKASSPTLASPQSSEVDFSYKRRYTSLDPLHTPLPVYPAPPSMEVEGYSNHIEEKMAKTREENL